MGRPRGKAALPAWQLLAALAAVALVAVAFRCAGASVAAVRAHGTPTTAEAAPPLLAVGACMGAPDCGYPSRPAQLLAANSALHARAALPRPVPCSRRVRGVVNWRRARAAPHPSQVSGAG